MERRLRLAKSNRFVRQCYAACLLACFPALGRAAEYSFVPVRLDGTKASHAISCVTPGGWQGWKDDPTFWNRLGGFDKRFLQGYNMSAVAFTRRNCTRGTDCERLVLETTARDARGQPDVKTRLQAFLTHLNEHQDSAEEPAHIVNLLHTFEIKGVGAVPIWEVRSSFYDDYFVSIILLSDVIVTIYLQTPDSEQVRQELGAVKELAQSIKVTNASPLSPDTIRIDVRETNDAIRRQLLTLTPLGTSFDDVYAVLQKRIYKDSLVLGKAGEIQRVNGALQIQIGNYWDGKSTQKGQAGGEQTSLPAPTIVEAAWRFDNNQKLHEIQIRRYVTGQPR